MQKKVTIILLTLFLLVGIGVLLYPAVSSYINQQNGSYAITQVQEQVGQLEEEQRQAQRQLAESYNAVLSQMGGDLSENGEVSADYYEILQFHDGIMGYLQIPKIEVNLPIYHGVGSDVLEKGAGHMPQSAFPIGGEGNHAVLTGHTPQPSAKLFTDLTELEEGDLFYICILEEILTYQVDQIKVVLPEQTEDLAPVAGEDHCTLLTCTPYGINSHRLLVRGTRVETPQNILAQSSEQEQRQPLVLWIVGAALAAAGITVAVVIVIRKRRRGRNGAV